MTYLLDTDTLIDCMVGINDIRDQVLGFIEHGDEVAVCAITVTELYSGMNDTRRAKWERWLRALPYWQISFEVAVQAGVHRKAAAASGRTLSVSDSLLAALTKEHDATLLTSNIKDYAGQDIRVLSLREKTT